MSMPYSPTSPTSSSAMADFRSDHRLPPISKMPDIYAHARPQSPPTSPESVTGSSHSSPKRRMSDQNELHDLLDRNRRKRSATSVQVLGPAAAARERFDDSRQQPPPPPPTLPAPRGLLHPEDRPQLPPLQTFLRSTQYEDMPPRGTYPPREPEPLSRGHSDSGAAPAGRLPPIVTADYPPPAHSRAPPTEYASKSSSYSSSRSALPSPYSTSPSSYAPPPASLSSSATSTPYRRPEREGPPESDAIRSNSLGSISGDGVPPRPPYDAYPPADRRYSTGYLPLHHQHGHHHHPPPPSGPPPPHHSRPHYPAMGPPPPGSDLPAHYVWEAPVAAINPNGRKRRGNLPKESTSILNDWFCRNIGFPYPKEEEKHHLQAMTGLSISQISNWFINARRRRRPEAVMRQAQGPYEEQARWKPTDQ